MIEIKKYRLWDSLDNLLDCYETGRADFSFVYQHSLVLLFNDYCSLLNIEQIPYYQISRYLSDPSYLSKYLKEPFPDQVFSNMFLMAIQTHEQGLMIKAYEGLLDYVYGQLGGFDIDGWHIRTLLNK